MSNNNMPWKLAPLWDIVLNGMPPVGTILKPQASDVGATPGEDRPAGEDYPSIWENPIASQSPQPNLGDISFKLDRNPTWPFLGKIESPALTPAQNFIATNVAENARKNALGFDFNLNMAKEYGMSPEDVEAARLRKELEDAGRALTEFTPPQPNYDLIEKGYDMLAQRPPAPQKTVTPVSKEGLIAAALLGLISPEHAAELAAIPFQAAIGATEQKHKEAMEQWSRDVDAQKLAAEIAIKKGELELDKATRQGERERQKLLERYNIAVKNLDALTKLKEAEEDRLRFLESKYAVADTSDEKKRYGGLLVQAGRMSQEDLDKEVANTKAVEDLKNRNLMARTAKTETATERDKLDIKWKQATFDDRVKMLKGALKEKEWGISIKEKMYHYWAQKDEWYAPLAAARLALLREYIKTQPFIRAGIELQNVIRAGVPDRQIFDNAYREWSKVHDELRNIDSDISYLKDKLYSYSGIDPETSIQETGQTVGQVVQAIRERIAELTEQRKPIEEAANKLKARMDQANEAITKTYGKASTTLRGFVDVRKRQGKSNPFAPLTLDVRFIGKGKK